MPWATPEQKTDVAYLVEDRPPNAAGWVRDHCPWCPPGVKRNLAFKADNGWFQCNRCDTKGWLNGPPAGDRGPEIKTYDIGVIPLPDGYESLEQDPLPLHLHPYLRYLYFQRHVPVDAIIEAGVGAVTSGKHAGSVCVPIDAHGLQVGWFCRSITGSRFSVPDNFQRQRFLFNQDALYQETDLPLGIVEGCLDALVMYPHAVACMGQYTDDQLDLMTEARRPLVVMLDADAQANGRALYWRLLLRGKDVRAAKLPPGTDPNKLQRERCMQLLTRDYFVIS